MTKDRIARFGLSLFSCHVGYALSAVFVSGSVAREDKYSAREIHAVL